MKGVVFTEFLEMVESRFSPEMADDIIEDAHLPHGGAYTAVGTYPHDEIVAMIVALSRRSGIQTPDIIHAEVLKRYQSPRHFEDLAEGLMRGCVDHFAEPIDVTRDAVPADRDAQRFVLTRRT